MIQPRVVEIVRGIYCSTAVLFRRRLLPILQGTILEMGAMTVPRITVCQKANTYHGDPNLAFTTFVSSEICAVISG